MPNPEWGSRVNGAVLVLRLSSLGDVVLTSAFLDSLSSVWPESRVTFVVREDLAEVALALPGVERVVAVRRRLGLFGLLGLASELARTPWAHVFDLHASVRSRVLTAGLRRRLRSGFDKQTVPRAILVALHRDLYAHFGGARSLRARMLTPLVRLGLRPALSDTRLVVAPSAHLLADAALTAAGVRAGERCIAVVPGARWPSKCWPAERFATLVERLSRDPAHRVLVLGGAAERSLASVVALGAPGRAVPLAGSLDLLTTAAVLARCHVAVVNDSGLLHIAEAVGRPVVAIFGPTSPQFGYAPYRPESVLLRDPPSCSPCSKNGSRPCMRPTHECMENISVDAVVAAVEKVLARVAPPNAPRTES